MDYTYQHTLANRQIFRRYASYCRLHVDALHPEGGLGVPWRVPFYLSYLYIYIYKIDFLPQAPKLMSVMSILSHLGRNHATVLQEFMYSLILASLTPDSSRYSTTVLQEFMYSLILASLTPDSSRYYNCTAGFYVQSYPSFTYSRFIQVLQLYCRSSCTVLSQLLLLQIQESIIQLYSRSLCTVLSQLQLLQIQLGIVQLYSRSSCTVLSQLPLLQMHLGIVQQYCRSLCTVLFQPHLLQIHPGITTVLQEFMYSLILSLNTVPNYIMQQRSTVHTVPNDLCLVYNSGVQYRTYCF